MTAVILLATFFPGVLMTGVGVVVGLMGAGWAIAGVVWMCSNCARFLVCGTVIALAACALMS